MFYRNFITVRKFLLILFSIIITFFSFLPITVSAADTNDSVLLIVKPNVDPRVISSQASIRVEFENQDNGNKYLIMLQPYNEYCAKVYVPKGEYRTISGDVSNDYNAEYPVQCTSFFARGFSTEVKFNVGDPNYKGTLPTNNNALLGDIDYNKTNSLLNEDNMVTLNQDQLNENMDPYNTDPNNPYLGHENIPTSTTETTQITSEYSTEINDENIIETTTETDLNQDTQRTPQQKKFSTIMTLIVIVIIVAIILYVRYRNANVFEFEED